MKRVFACLAFTALASCAMIAGSMRADPPAKEPTPVEVIAKQQAAIEKQAALIAQLQQQIAAQKPVANPVANAIKPAGKAEQKFPRGGKASPRNVLQAATPFRPFKAAPTQFAIVPPQLSMWYNDTYGICVTAQEAFSKAAWSIQCGLPELFVPDAEVLRWANKYGFRDGANLTDVMDVMKRDGFTVNGVNYKDGPYNGVDYSNPSILQSAISSGPVNIAIDANALPSGAGNQNGWFATGGRPGQYPNTDHCVALCGYGPAPFLFQQVGATVPPALVGKSGYLLFTWNTIGFVDQDWVMSTVAEAWVRLPTTPGQTPPPPPSTVTVPGVIGFTLANAKTAIEQAGLVFSTTETDLTRAVTSEVPVGGTQVAAGSTVTVSAGVTPPPAPGDIVVTIPAGTPPGNYTIGSGLTPDNMAVLQAIQDAIAEMLGQQAQNDPPPGWMRDKEVMGVFGKSMEKAGHGADFAKVQKHPLANHLMMRNLHRNMTKDAEGRALLAQYKAGALPVGWLTNLLDWFIKNGPALIDLIMQIMKLFGFAEAPTPWPPVYAVVSPPVFALAA